MKQLATAALLLAFAAVMGVSAWAAPQQTSAETSTTTTRTTHKATKEKTSSKLDINSASQQELEALPGIGPATSAKIVQGRPYRSKSDLLKGKIVSRSEYEKIKNDIVAHQKK
jgi:DNA uptake protein ComE-like DNA-binding protein